MSKRISWGVVILFNLLLIGTVSFVFMAMTDRYIEEQREQTLVYDINALRRQVLLPRQNYDNGTVEYRVNGDGYRGPAPSVIEPDSYRIFVMGGSSVFDSLVGEGLSWPEKLSRSMGHTGGKSVHSFNLGIPGYSTRESLAHFHDRARWWEPDLVILYHGWNDAKYMERFRVEINTDRFFSVRNWRDRYKFLTAARPARNFAAFKLMMETYYDDKDRLRENRRADVGGKGSGELYFASILPVARPMVPESTGTVLQEPNDWLATPGMEYFKENVIAFIQSVRRSGAIPVVMTQATLAANDLTLEDEALISLNFVGLRLPQLVALNEAMSQSLRSAAADTGAIFIDLREALSGSNRYLADHVHLTPAGSDRLAVLLSQRLAANLSDLYYLRTE